MRQRLDANLGFCFRSLMRDGRNDALDQFAGIDPHRLKRASPLAGEVEDCGDQAIHLGDRRFDEAERLGETLRKLLVGAFENGLSRIGGVIRRRRSHGFGAGKARNPFENVGAQFLEFASEAHDVH